MGFDRAVNGDNDLFGESVSLMDFIKVCTVFEFCLCFSWLATLPFALNRPVPLWSLCLTLKWPPAFELIFKFKITATRIYLDLPQVD